MMPSSSNITITPFIKETEHLSIPFRDIKEATKNFTTIIGKGGYGAVYKGELLLSGKLTTVAVKRLDSNISGQGFKEFLTEIDLLSRCKHPNLVSLLGFCEEEDEKIILYEYAEHGSLDKYLCMVKNSRPLTWMQRINICIDAARGLDYLHNHVAQDHRVIHRDIKSANVLLGQDWKAMIADFGLSKIGRANENVTYIITNASGTHGYCDPAYMHTGILTKESDIYSFGVVLFEVLCGRLGYINVNSEQRFLAPLAQRYYEEGNIEEIIDPYLKTEVDQSSLSMFSDIAYQCLQNDRGRRPSVSLVLQKLEQILELIDVKDDAIELAKKEVDFDGDTLIEEEEFIDGFRKWMEATKDIVNNKPSKSSDIISWKDLYQLLQPWIQARKNEQDIDHDKNTPLGKFNQEDLTPGVSSLKRLFESLDLDNNKFVSISELKKRLMDADFGRYHEMWIKQHGSA